MCSNTRASVCAVVSDIHLRHRCFSNILYHKIIIYDANVRRNGSQINHSGENKQEMYMLCVKYYLLCNFRCICAYTVWSVRKFFSMIEIQRFIGVESFHKTNEQKQHHAPELSVLTFKV